MGLRTIAPGAGQGAHKSKYVPASSAVHRIYLTLRSLTHTITTLATTTCSPLDPHALLWSFMHTYARTHTRTHTHTRARTLYRVAFYAHARTNAHNTVTLAWFILPLPVEGDYHEELRGKSTSPHAVPENTTSPTYYMYANCPPTSPRYIIQYHIHTFSDKPYLIWGVMNYCYMCFPGRKAFA